MRGGSSDTLLVVAPVLQDMAEGVYQPLALQHSESLLVQIERLSTSKRAEKAVRERQKKINETPRSLEHEYAGRAYLLYKKRYESDAGSFAAVYIGLLVGN